jgi:mono/diheme cytochrome c family protein
MVKFMDAARGLCGLTAALCAGLAGPAHAQASKVDGHQAYLTACAACHAEDLSGGTGPALKGEVFLSHWGAPHAPKELFSRLRTSMPVGAPGSLTVEQYAAITLYLLGQNGAAPAPAAPAASSR